LGTDTVQQAPDVLAAIFAPSAAASAGKSGKSGKSGRFSALYIRVNVDRHSILLVM
jgi:hypothetical protein